MMRKLYAAALLGLAASSFGACLFPDLSSFQRNEGGAGHPSGSGGGAGTGASAGNGGSGGSTSSSNPTGTGGGKLAACELRAHQKGSKGVPFEPPGAHRCIDATETSWVQYLEFYNEALNKLPDLGDYADVCAWKTTADEYKPEGYIYGDFQNDNVNHKYDKRPVEGVDWCDAAIYCQWAGKTICGDRTGKAVDRLLDAGWQESTEWYYACMANRLPDASFDDPKCYPPTDGGNEFDDTLDVGGCPGAIGMDHSVSNVWEWEANCTSDHNTQGYQYDDCRYRGWPDPFTSGDPGQDEANHCASENPDPSTIRNPHAAGLFKPTNVGIRCCWEPNP